MQVIEAAAQGDWEKVIMVDGCSVLLKLSQTTECIHMCLSTSVYGIF